MNIYWESFKDYFRLGQSEIQSPEIHLESAMKWLCAAQDVGDDNGVSRMYHVKSGWGASYPETTGYIIPTFISYYKLTGNKEYLDRALLMADWESDVQLDSGAVQGGTISDKPSPAIFNTGQVLFGWISAFKETKNTKYLESIKTASEFLCDHQDQDGAWRKNLSAFCSAPVDSYTYNIRSAWALWMAGELTGNNTYKEHAERNLEYVLSITDDNGWSTKNCLNDPNAPLLHTIAYTHQGILELSMLCNNECGLEKVTLGNEFLLKDFNKNHQLKGRYDAKWDPAVRWRCLSGEAQTSIVWFRLGEISGHSKWKEAGTLLNRTIKRTQNLSGHVEYRGGIKGSYPIYGWYGKYEYLNWAGKFFADALMLEMGLSEASISG